MIYSVNRFCSIKRKTSKITYRDSHKLEEGAGLFLLYKKHTQKQNKKTNTVGLAFYDRSHARFKIILVDVNKTAHK